MAADVVLSPHFDDAVLSCWNVLERTEEPIDVVTVFAGMPPAGTSTQWDAMCGQPDSQAMMRDRASENERALAAISARAVNLSHLDGQYTRDERDIPAIAESIAEVADPDATVYAPIAISGYRKHLDHIAVQQAAKLLGDMGRDVIFYADLPYAIPYPLLGERRWPARKSAGRIGRMLGLSLESETIELSEPERAAKRRTLQSYATQFGQLRRIRLGLLMQPHFYRYEMLFRPAALRPEI